MKHIKRIRNISRLLRFACLAGIILAPLFIAVYWVNNGAGILLLPKINWYLQFASVPFISIEDLPPFLKWTGFLVDLIPCSFLLAYLFILMKLFKLYEKLEFFSKNNIRYIRGIAIVLFISQLVHPFYTALHTYILTLANPLAERAVLIAYGPQEIKTLFLACVVFLAALVMEQGKYLQEEYSSTI
jgi:hypothetical protein